MFRYGAWSLSPRSPWTRPPYWSVYLQGPLDSLPPPVLPRRRGERRFALLTKYTSSKYLERIAPWRRMCTVKLTRLGRRHWNKCSWIQLFSNKFCRYIKRNTGCFYWWPMGVNLRSRNLARASISFHSCFCPRPSIIPSVVQRICRANHTWKDGRVPRWVSRGIKSGFIGWRAQSLTSSRLL